MGSVGFLKSKSFFKHLGIAVLAAVLLFWFTVMALDWYTHQGEALEVPDFTGIQIGEARTMNLDGDFVFMVIDSVYDDHFGKGDIVLQDPPPGSKVKRGRKIYVTTVAIQPEMVKMPNLVDLSLRQALRQLKASGLKLDRLTYVENFARNAVLSQVVDGDTLLPGTDLLKGSSVEVILGKGLNGEKVNVPFLIGKTEREALHIINNSALNVGYLKFLDGRDKQHSRVYQQQPQALSDDEAAYGAYVDLWFRLDDDFNFDSLIVAMQEEAAGVDSLGLINDIQEDN